MNEQLAARQRRRELLITLSYTLFSVMMVIVTAVSNWPIIYMPLILAEIAIVWLNYIRKSQTYFLRAVLVTAFVNLNVFLYGIQGENFFVLIPTLCVEIVLLSLYEIPRIIDISILKAILLFLYHLLAKGYTFPTDALERKRIMLQMVSFVVLIGLTIYRIHHHQQEEDDTIELEKQVRREQRIKDDFVANTSHELRTPVNTISGMCEILLQKTLPDEVYSGVLDIQMTGVELQNIVTDVLDYSALESGTWTLSPRAYNITSTLNDVMNMTVFENRDKQLEIIFDCDPTIPCKLEGDEQQLRRVLNSLISNAIKFTAEGGVTVRVTHRPEEYGINLIVSVRDTGVGMDLEEQERVLRDFYQADGSRSRSSSGMGLGLALSSALIKKMGGFLTIKSKPGKGSDFTFAIPQKVLNEQPCISLKHPGAIKLVWYYNPQSPVPSMRDSFVDHIKHFSDYFGVYSERAASLDECKRRVSRDSSAHLILGLNEYREDKEYFDDLAEKIPIILIADRGDTPEASSHIHVLYRPYNAIMLAEILNGSEQTSIPTKKEQKLFIAPTAKILVVDDNLMNLKVVEGLLRKYKIKIVAATSGEEALSLIESRDYDFVFMDHMMPGMDGVECFHHIRRKEGAYFRQVPIIALTANAIAGSREMFLSEGFNEFVAKPIDTSLLNSVLQRFIPPQKQLSEEEYVEVSPEDLKAFEEEIAASQKDMPQPVSQGTIPVAQKEVSRPAPRESAPMTYKDEDLAAQRAVVQAEAKAAARKAKEEAEAKAATKPEGDPFAHMPGIDKETALLYCGSAEDFLELADVYCTSGKNYVKELEEAYEAMDLKNYGLIAHTIKSTSKTLGAVDLADLALEQEMAAKEGREEDVRAKHDSLRSEYTRVLTMISDYFGGDTGVEEAVQEIVAETDAQDWPSLKEKLRGCLEAFETRSFEECLAAAKGLLVDGKPVEEALSGVMEKASNFDFEGAIAELDEIGGAA